ncbi:MAG: STY0301 family protein [Acidovorax sp.]|uniref:STY0301 family protein n=1 Tax=Acidovorax sp. TaxID=1872122 RepID=UPI00391DA5D6
MPCKKTLAVILIALGAASSAWAQQPAGAALSPSESVCPRSLQVQQTPSDKVAPGWQVRSSNDSHPLFNIAFYEGPPELLVQQAPHRQQRRGKTLSSQWIFSPSTQQYWVACEYWGTSAIATRPLDKNITGCTAEHDMDTSPPTVKRWACANPAAKPPAPPPAPAPANTATP